MKIHQKTDVATISRTHWDVTSFHIFIFFHNNHIFPVTSNCTRAVYSPIEKLLNQCWRINKSCQNTAYSVYFLISQTNPKQLLPQAQALFFLFYQNKDMQISCFAVASTPPLETSFYWLVFHIPLTRYSVFVCLSASDIAS